MRKRMLFILSFILMGLTMMSCSKDKAVPETENLDAVLEEIFTADVMEDVLAEVFNDIFDGSDYEMYKSGEESDGHKCRTRTIERPTDEPFPKIVTLEFDGNCKDWKGNVRSGKIIITIYGPYKTEGSVRVITFEDYFVNGNQVEGTKTITTLGRNEIGNLVVSIDFPDSKIIRSDGAVIERTVSKTREWIVGEDTPETNQDNEFLINGVVTRLNKDNVLITKTKYDIHRARNCRWPLSGTVEITADDGRPPALLNYGDGECDKWAIITIEGEVWRIDLKDRGKKWKKVD